jgi:hypothetical protein
MWDWERVGDSTSSHVGKALKGASERVVTSKFSSNRRSHLRRWTNISHGNAMFANASGPCILPSSGSEMRKIYRFMGRYLKIGVDNMEKKRSVAITLSF